MQQLILFSNKHSHYILVVDFGAVVVFSKGQTYVSFQIKCCMKKQCSRLKNVEKRSQIIKSEGKKCFFFSKRLKCVVHLNTTYSFLCLRELLFSKSVYFYRFSAYHCFVHFYFYLLFTKFVMQYRCAVFTPLVEIHCKNTLVSI